MPDAVDMSAVADKADVVVRDIYWANSAYPLVLLSPR